jgi:hypothetical protein
VRLGDAVEQLVERLDVDAAHVPMRLLDLRPQVDGVGRW